LYYGLLTAYGLLGLGAVFYVYFNPRRQAQSANIRSTSYGKPKNEPPSAVSNTAASTADRGEFPAVVEGIGLALLRAELEYSVRTPIAARCPKCSQNLAASPHEIASTVILRCPCGACERTILAS
jgi:hypothetical protein